MYAKLSGMTGTAKTEEEEFRNIYNMYVVEVPTNRPVVRDDRPDLLFATIDAKYNYMLEDIKKIHATGQPILIGTVAVETSEIISRLLKKAGIKHDVLNAKNHSREAEIIANAGQIGAVTIATNMAGRGTDIKLGEGVKELGGLAIIGTERHESRRIDNQLRGRSGRQGDPGFSRFYLSADDELLMRFGGETFKKRIEMLVTLGSGDVNEPLESKTFTKVVSNAQKRIEGNNFDSRKTVLKYDEVLRKQRETFYAQRREVIMRDDVTEIVHSLIKNFVEETCYQHMEEVGRNKYKIDDEAIVNAFNGPIYPPNTLDIEKMKTMDEKEIVDYVYGRCLDLFEEKKRMLPDPKMWHDFTKHVTLQVLTTFWTKHIDSMSELRQSVRLQSYAQQNPLIMYQQVGFERFEEMMDNIGKDVTKFLAHVKVQIEVKPREEKQEQYQTNQAEDQSLAKKPAKVDPNKKLKPNEPCYCGSGKKYKYCCGARR
jgi:preprotein translocase subunit SecA